MIVGYSIGNLIQPLIRKRHANVLCLTAINAATKRPTPVLVGAVVDEALLAEEALAAKGYRIVYKSILIKKWIIWVAEARGSSSYS